MAGGGLLLLSFAPNYWSFFFIYIFLVALGNNAGFFHPLSAAVNNWFIRQRGIGFSWITAAGGIGAVFGTGADNQTSVKTDGDQFAKALAGYRATAGSPLR